VSNPLWYAQDLHRRLEERGCIRKPKPDEWRCICETINQLKNDPDKCRSGGIDRLEGRTG
jgi:hypothetical protein